MPCSVAGFGQICRLRGARDGWQHRPMRRRLPRRLERLESRRMLTDEIGVSPTTLMTAVFCMTRCLQRIAGIPASYRRQPMLP